MVFYLCLFLVILIFSIIFIKKSIFFTKLYLKNFFSRFSKINKVALLIVNTNYFVLQRLINTELLANYSTSLLPLQKK